MKAERWRGLPQQVLVGESNTKLMLTGNQSLTLQSFCATVISFPDLLLTAGRNINKGRCALHNQRGLLLMMYVNKSII